MSTVSAHDNRSDRTLGRSDQIILHIHREEEPRFGDIIEIGTPGKGGLLKIRFNADDPTGSMRRVENAVRVRAFAQERLEHPPSPSGGDSG